MNNLGFNQSAPLHAGIYGATGPDELVAMSVDATGRPILTVDTTQTIAAANLDVRNLSGASDTAVITATGFDIRPLSGANDSLIQLENFNAVASDTATLVLGGTTVLTMDTSPYSYGIFVVRADFISLLTTVTLQLSPVNTTAYYVDDGSHSGLLLGGVYVLKPTRLARYARIFATGIGSVLTAYYFGQA